MKNPAIRSWLHALTQESLAKENRDYACSGGISANNRQQGFMPAFLDTGTGTVYRSCFPDGRPAPVHILAGLPEELLVTGSQASDRRAIKGSVISGFVFEDAFYTREEAARTVNTRDRVH